jgi:hypothetical protein
VNIIEIHDRVAAEMHNEYRTIEFKSNLSIRRYPFLEITINGKSTENPMIASTEAGYEKCMRIIFKNVLVQEELRRDKLLQ